MAIKIEKGTSRLVHAKFVVVGGIGFWTRPEIRDIPVGLGDRVHEVESSDRIDLLAKKYYQRPKLWWVIAHANDLFDLPVELSSGVRLRIPDPFLVRKHLLV